MDKAFSVVKGVEIKIMATSRVSTNTNRDWNVPTPNLTLPTRLTAWQLVELREKELCFNCNDKYNNDHKFGEKKLFYIDELEPFQSLK